MLHPKRVVPIKMSNFRILMCLSLLLGACGGKAKKVVKKEVLTRSGSLVESTSFKYADFEPVISHSGERVLFVSGRESGQSQVTFKIFRIDWPLGQEPKPATRLTGQQDIGQENEVTLSPDGKYALIGSVQNSSKDLFIKSLDAVATSTEGLVRVSQNRDFETVGEFSPDSKYFIWTVRTGTKTEFRLASVKDALENPLNPAFHYVVSDPFDGVGQSVWIPTNEGSPYRLILAKSKQGSLYQFEEVQFSDPKAPTVKPVVLAEPFAKGVVLKKGSKLTANKKQLFMVQEISGTTQQTVERVGDGPVPENGVKEKSAVFSALLAFDHLDMSLLKVQNAGAEPNGLDTLATSWNSEGQFGVILNRSYFRCVEDNAALFGASILLADLAGFSRENAPSYTRKTLRFNGIEGQPQEPKAPKDPKDLSQVENWLFSAKTGFCSRKLPQGYIERLDNNITNIVMNGGGSKQSFRMIYVSRFVPRVDNKCELKAGDLEVRAAEWVGDVAKFYQLTPNRAPIANAPVQDAECSVYWGAID